MQIFQEQKPVQQQRPQMYAAVEILQLDVCQLQSYINTALLENRTLECGSRAGRAVCLSTIYTPAGMPPRARMRSTCSRILPTGTPSPTART